MSDIVPGLTAPVPPENRLAHLRQSHVAPGQLALQQPGLVPPVSARVAAAADAARDVRDRNRERRTRRPAPSRDPGRGGLIDREL
jgi:hypothetical protein